MVRAEAHSKGQQKTQTRLEVERVDFAIKVYFPRNDERILS